MINFGRHGLLESYAGVKITVFRLPGGEQFVFDYIVAVFVLNTPNKLPFVIPRCL